MGRLRPEWRRRGSWIPCGPAEAWPGRCLQQRAGGTNSFAVSWHASRCDSPVFTSALYLFSFNSNADPFLDCCGSLYPYNVHPQSRQCTILPRAACLNNNLFTQPQRGDPAGLSECLLLSQLCFLPSGGVSLMAAPCRACRYKFDQLC